MIANVVLLLMFYQLLITFLLTIKKRFVYLCNKPQIIMKRFLVKPNFGHFKVVDSTTNKIVVGYRTKKGAELTAEGLNILKTENAIENRIKSLKTIKGYGYYAFR